MLQLWLLTHSSGYSDQPSVDHCVAVIGFGRGINVLQNFSNDYNTILHILGENCFKKMYGLSINKYITSNMKHINVHKNNTFSKCTNPNL